MVKMLRSASDKKIFKTFAHKTASMDNGKKLTNAINKNKNYTMRESTSTVLL